MPPRKKITKRKKASVPTSTATAQPAAGPSADPAAEPDPATAAGEQQAPGGPEEDATSAGPSEEDTRKEALQLILANVADVTVERAVKALETTAQHARDGADIWAEEAMIALALDAEVGEEADKMGQAMQESLVEAEARRASEKPLAERSPAELRDLFSASELLGCLRECVGGDCTPLLFSDEDGGALKREVLRYLEMEQRCKRWYGNCSAVYFETVGAAAAAEAAQSDLTAATAALEAGCGGAAAPEGEGPAEKRQRCGSDAPSEWAAALLRFLEKQLETLEREVYARPTAGEAVPTIFAALESKEAVELLDD